MFAEYNTDKFPAVYVTFSGKINSEEEFDGFLQSWLDLYKDQNNFLFIFDTREMSYPDLKYCFKMALFIKRLRKESYHYLQKSLILVNDNRIKRLLDFVFTMQSPVAPVYLWLTEETDESIIHQKLLDSDENDEDIIYIEPNQSLIPFL
tara:strand:+ start:230 stop:676 length:447 start_codon:yes stop_codon:yes gene_type:complete